MIADGQSVSPRLHYFPSWLNPQEVILWAWRFHNPQKSQNNRISRSLFVSPAEVSLRVRLNNKHTKTYSSTSSSSKGDNFQVQKN